MPVQCWRLNKGNECYLVQYSRAISTEATSTHSGSIMTTMLCPVRDDQSSRVAISHFYLNDKQESISETSEARRSSIGIQYRLATFEVQSIAISRTQQGLSVVECVWRVKIESKDPEALQLKVQVVSIVARFILLQICTYIGWTLEACLGPSAEVEPASFTYKVDCRLWRHLHRSFQAGPGLRLSVHVWRIDIAQRTCKALQPREQECWPRCS
jgi:hypothetical protein